MLASVRGHCHVRPKSSMVPVFGLSRSNEVIAEQVDFLLTRVCGGWDDNGQPCFLSPPTDE